MLLFGNNLARHHAMLTCILQASRPYPIFFLTWLGWFVRVGLWQFENYLGCDRRRTSVHKNLWLIYFNFLFETKKNCKKIRELRRWEKGEISRKKEVSQIPIRFFTANFLLYHHTTNRTIMAYATTLVDFWLFFPIKYIVF